MTQYYHLRDSIYITQFRDELILLDTIQDKYVICFPEIAKRLMDLLEGNKPSFTDDSIKRLLNDQIIEEKNSPFQFYIDCKPNSIGVSNVDWRLPLDNKRVGITWDVSKALMTLIKVHFYLKVRGFYRTIRMIRRSRENNFDYQIPSQEQLLDLARIVNQACLLYPTHTKCLEWAMTFVLLAIKCGWKCNLEIGVQNYPFMAHAWVECNGQVVMDSQDLRDGLGIILNEPFRRART